MLNMRRNFFLGVLFAGVLFLNAREARSETASEGPQGTEAPAVAQPEKGEGASEEVPGVTDAVQKAQEDIQDPFRIDEYSMPEAPVQTVGPEVPVLLQGLGFGKEESFAVLNSNVYYVGEEKEGIKLLEVRKGEADILVNGNPRTIKLLPEEEIQQATKRLEKRKKKDAKTLSLPGSSL